jgi:hypothetical protein
MRWRQIQEQITASQLWKSIFRVGIPNTNRKRVLAMLGNVVLHLHPVKTRKSGVKMRYTWCAGGVTFFLFLLTFTGLLLMFYYRPTSVRLRGHPRPARAKAPFGIMREVHRGGPTRWSFGLDPHVPRFMTGSYKPPRGSTGHQRHFAQGRCSSPPRGTAAVGPLAIWPSRSDQLASATPLIAPGSARAC